MDKVLYTACLHRYFYFAVACAIVILYFTRQKCLPVFLPEMDEGGIVLDFNSPPGTTLDETDRMLKEVDRIIQEQPEVASYSRRLGTQMGFFYY